MIDALAMLTIWCFIGLVSLMVPPLFLIWFLITFLAVCFRIWGWMASR